MRTLIHPAAFLSGAIAFCAFWLWLEPVQPPFENMTSRHDPRVPRTSIELDSAILERYAGHYEGRADFVADLSVKDGRLYLASPLISAQWEMLATSDVEFFLKQSPDIDVKFRVSRRGDVTGFDAATPYGPMRFDRER